MPSALRINRSSILLDFLHLDNLRAPQIKCLLFLILLTNTSSHSSIASVYIWAKFLVYLIEVKDIITFPSNIFLKIISIYVFIWLCQVLGAISGIIYPYCSMWDLVP